MKWRVMITILTLGVISIMIVYYTTFYIAEVIMKEKQFPYIHRTAIERGLNEHEGISNR